MSALLALPDHLYPVVPRPRSMRFFRKGWGDEQRCHDAQQFMLEWLSNGNGPAVAGQSVRCALKTGTNIGSFRSPLAHFLPPESQEAKFEACLPAAPRAVVVLFSSIGDQSRSFRRSKRSEFEPKRIATDPSPFPRPHAAPHYCSNDDGSLNPTTHQSCLRGCWCNGASA